MTNIWPEFESEIQAFEKSPTPQGANVFYGSSSIRLWENLAQCFPGVSVLNRGFGGSTLAECLHFLPRVIIPLHPATLVLCAGDNDLDQRVTPEQLLSVFRQFIARVREDAPLLPIAYISIKPSPIRFWNLSNIRRANALIQAATADFPHVTFLDLFPLMLSPAGGSRPELFTEDGLHMSPAGYALWTPHVRAWLDAQSS
jgi:lysophospholipase L1-like esterase